MSGPRALLLDLDDTLYDYFPREREARAALLEVIARDLGSSLDQVALLYREARTRVKARLGERAASHSRLLYLHELAHAASVPPALPRVRAWNEVFWRAYLADAALRPGARELLTAWRAQGNKVAIVTDLVMDIQLWKLEVFGLFALIDALVVSEEVPFDKPAREPFELAMERLGVAPSACIVVGDNARKDGEGARALGLPYYRVHGSDPAESEGLSLTEVGRALGVLP